VLLLSSECLSEVALDPKRKLRNSQLCVHLSNMPDQVSCYRAEYSVSLKAHAWTKRETYEWRDLVYRSMQMSDIYLFIRSLFNDAFSITQDYILLNKRMIRK
jgi:hypothetical protein